MQSMEITLKKTDITLRDKILKISGEDFNKCYQCGMCTSGCPVADEMDIMPNQVNMMLMLGQFEELLNSQTIWICVACFECGERCPHNIDLAKINEALREIKIRENIDLFNIWETASTGEFPTIALVASFRKFTS